MGRPAGVRRSFRWPTSRAALAVELEAEMEHHVAACADALVDEGWEPEAARREALRRFGDPGAVRRECSAIDRDRARRVTLADSLFALAHDVRLAARQLARTPALTVLAAVTLAVGIGATTSIYGIFHAVLLRPLPVDEPERVVFVWEDWEGGFSEVSAGNFDEWRRGTSSFDAMAAMKGASLNLAGGGEPERVAGLQVTAGWFDLLGAAPRHGRTFRPEEDVPGRDAVAVMSHELWQRRFGGDRAVVGREMRIDGRVRTIVGVMPPDFDPLAWDVDLWVPMAFSAERLAMLDEHSYWVVGRLARGVPREQAQQELRAISTRLQEAAFDNQRETRAHVAGVVDSLVEGYRTPLLVLLGAVLLVLVIACANVTNLLLARGAARAREMAIRTALGSPRRRLVRMMLTESAVLAVPAGLLGLGLAAAGIRALVALAPPNVPRLDGASLDAPVVAVAVLLSFAACLLAGLAPAWRASRGNPQQVLVEGTAGAGGGRDRVRGGLIAAEVGLSLALLIGAGLLIRSGIEMARVDPGFDVEGVVTVRLTLSSTRYPEPPQVTAAFEEIVEAARALPGVASASLTNRVPMGSGPDSSNGLLPEGVPFSPEAVVQSQLRLVTPQHFETLGLELLRGRGFTAADHAGAQRVMVLSETAARRLFPNEEAIGQRVGCCDPELKTVVGVVRGTRPWNLATEPPPEFYLPLAQAPPDAWRWLQNTMDLVVRSERQPEAVVAALGDALRRIDPELPLYDVATLEERVGRSLAGARFNTFLLAVLGAIGLLLAAVGIYGTVAHGVEQRRREIGVRMALGATPRHAVRLMVWRTLPALVAGLAVGLAAAAASGRVLEEQLFGVAAADPATWAAVVAVLAAVALAASFLPARRAARVDPATTLSDL
ncbi:MAG TPA: ABC transporter permease [Thermoanaerobaculia bacterium]